MRPKPKQFATQYASIFGDASVVSAYQYRRPYPAETFDLLISLLDADAETLRNLRPHYIAPLKALCNRKFKSRFFAQSEDDSSA